MVKLYGFYFWVLHILCIHTIHTQKVHQLSDST